jgi:hypothetical protein
MWTSVYTMSKDIRLNIGRVRWDPVKNEWVPLEKPQEISKVEPKLHTGQYL